MEQPPPGAARSGEGQHIHIHRQCQRLSGDGAFARDDIQHSVRQARLARPAYFRKIYYYGNFAYLGVVFFIGIVPGLVPMTIGLIV